MSKQIEVLSGVHGIAPRSEELFRLGADLERGRVSSDAFEEQVLQEADDWLALQTEAGIDIPGDSKLTWQDHLRPLVRASTDVDVDNAPVTRWFEDNRFYRRPTITSGLSFSPEVFQASSGPSVEATSLVAPYTFRELCDWSEDLTEEEIDAAVLDLYSNVLKHLNGNNVRRVVLEEYGAPKTVEERILNPRPLAWTSFLASRLPDLEVAYLNIGQESQLIPSVYPNNLSLGISGSAIDSLNGFGGHGSILADREIWQQVVDSDRTLADAFSLSDGSLDALRHAKPARIVLTNTVDFELLPLVSAAEKIKRLAAFANQLQEHLDREL